MAADNERDGSAFEVLIASQWGERSTARLFDVPERKLLLAVLVDAVRVLLGSDQRERAGVVAWIRGEAARMPFQDLCYNLELDPDQVSRKLLRSDVLRREAHRTRVSSPRRVQSAGRRTRRAVSEAARQVPRLLSA